MQSKFKHTILLSIIMLLIVSIPFSGCKNKPPTISNSKSYFPAGWEKLKFGMSLQKVKELRPEMRENTDNAMSFRREFVELPTTGDIDGVVYYFDKENNEPYYEVIYQFKTVELRDKAATELLGTPNAEDDDGQITEWRFKDKSLGFDIRAWKYKRKLIFVGLVPDTEWAEEEE